MNRSTLAISSVTGGLSSALLPVLAVFLLPVADYGAFALVYLLFAEGWSIQLSAVCDTWARRRAAGSSAGTWGDYSRALAVLSGAVALLTLVVGWWVYESSLLGASMALAVGASLYRQGARYHHAVEHGPGSVVPSDVVAVLGLVAGVVGLGASGQPLLTSLLLAWAVSSLVAAALFLKGARRGRGPVAWYRRNAPTVRVLLGESLLMDLGAAGTPLLVAPVLGLYRFGIYRSVSSLSVPLQLLIDPVRPYLSQIGMARLVRPPVLGTLLAAATALGVAGYAVLAHAVPAFLSFSPVLVALSDFAFPCALFLGFQFLTYVMNIFARMHVSHRRLLVGRSVHTVFAVALPVGGAVLWSVSGAIWGFVVSTALTVIIWSGLLVSGAREDRIAASRPELPRDAVGG
ncbi:hypothetical protein ACI78T_15675 [Blastococcus sp. SYSU D00922]